MVNALPGGVGVSGLRVYDWPSADGVCVGMCGRLDTYDPCAAG